MYRRSIYETVGTPGHHMQVEVGQQRTYRFDSEHFRLEKGPQPDLLVNLPLYHEGRIYEHCRGIFEVLWYMLEGRAMSAEMLNLLYCLDMLRHDRRQRIQSTTEDGHHINLWSMLYKFKRRTKKGY